MNQAGESDECVSRLEAKSEMNSKVYYSEVEKLRHDNLRSLLINLLLWIIMWGWRERKRRLEVTNSKIFALFKKTIKISFAPLWEMNQDTIWYIQFFGGEK